MRAPPEEVPVPPTTTGKRPYRRPAIASSETYERMALACTGSFNEMFMGCLLPKNSMGTLMCAIACQGS